MKSKITLLAGLIIFSQVYWLFKLHAQDINDIGSLPDQVDLATGTPIINIPLWTVQDRDIAVPISLSYNATGIKADQTASWVGLGWNLDVGGTITRSVRSLPDDAHPDNNIFWEDESLGWLFNDVSIKVNDFDVSSEQSRSLDYYLHFANQDIGGRDMEPDIYYFQVGGLSGSFVFDHGLSASERPIKLISHHNLQISYALNEETNELSSFTIIDTKGYSYTFEQREIVYSSSQNNLLGSKDTEPPTWYHWFYPGFDYPMTSAQISEILKPHNRRYLKNIIIMSSFNGLEPFNEIFYSAFTLTWFLTSVESPTGNGLTLNYIPETILLDEYPGASHRDYGNPDPDPEIPSQIEDMTYNYMIEDEIQPRIETQRISSIETNEYLIEFVANEDREDMRINESYPAAKKLEQIVVKKKNGTELDMIRVFDFYQSYYESGSLDYVYNDEVSAEKRLMLDKIVESCGDISLSPYEFSYIDNSLPSRYTTETDIWGFYKQTGTIETVPKVWVYPALTGSDKFRLHPIPGYTGTEYILPGTDRTPVTFSYTSGTLQEITLPAGGKIKYEYEPHSFLYDNVEYEGIGIRLKKLRLKDGDGIGSNDIVTEYIYTDNDVTTGKLLNMPKCGHFDPTAELVDELDFYNWSYIRHGNDIADYSEGTILYEKVNVLRGNQGKTEYYFSVPFTYMSTENEELITQTLWHKYLFDYPDGPEPTINDLYFTHHSYPYPPNVNYSWNRGQLLAQIEYGIEGGDWFKTESLYNQFEIYYNNGSGPEIVYGIKSGFLTNNYYYNSTGSGISEPLAVCGKYPIWTGVNSLINKNTHVIYSKDNPIDSIYSETFYSYNELGLLSETKTDNGEKTKLTRIKYSGDYNIEDPTSPDEMTKSLISLQENNLIDVPVETINLLESGSDFFVMDGSLILYKDFGTVAQPMILPEKIHNLDLFNPINLSLFNISSVDNNDFLYDNDYKLKVINNKYDTKGNLIEYYNPNDITYSTIYNTSNIPVAKISNASYDEFCYEGYEFEDENTPYSWYNYDNPLNQLISVDIKHSGSSSLKILSHEEDGFASKIFSPIEINSQGRYIFSAWAYTENIDSEFNIYLKIVRINNYPAYVTANYSTQYIGEWQHLLVEANLSDYPDVEFVIPTVCHTGQQSLPGYFDDIRFYPADALMTTKTYNKLNWKTSSMGPNETPTIIEYDDLGRPILTRDYEGNILSEIIYNNND